MFSFLFPSSDLFSCLQKPFTPGFLQFHNGMMSFSSGKFPFVTYKSSPLFSQSSLELLLCGYWFSGVILLFLFISLLFASLLLPLCFGRIFLIFFSFFFVLIYSFCWLILFLTLSALCPGVGERVIWLYEGEF